MFTEQDLKSFEAKGISLERAEWQLKQFTNGVKPIHLIAPATDKKGISILDNIDKYIEKLKNSEVSYTKFVPASGAASRMFKDLFEFRETYKSEGSEAGELSVFIQNFFTNIKRFAFCNDLNVLLKDKGGIEAYIQKKMYVEILDTLLDDSGLAYGSLPKGLLKFHYYAGNIGRTPFEEHLVEGAKYAKSSDGTVNLHFTVSSEHMTLFNKLKDTILSKYEDMYSVKYRISFSVQKPSTDTMAVTDKNTPFYDNDGSILFRPGGHGALIENLNELDSDIIFIKNIDNVVPEKKIENTAKVKKALAGFVLEIQQSIFSLIKDLTDEATDANLIKAKEFISDVLCIEGFDASSTEGMIEILDRPLRVCGMVKNEGEPGGGPYLIKDSNGMISPQVVESSQVDMSDQMQEGIFKEATHFNPVDLVCAVKDKDGKKYDLTKYVDESTCFISHKSKDGKNLKALELPGLWNGAMANWNTVFVEVPASTFNPVKNVNDLLREAHQ